jgi:hypothetical protein
MWLSTILNFVWSIGNSSIDVYEWQEEDVRKLRLPNSPDFKKLATAKGKLNFSGWELAHAVVKADFLDRRNLTMPGLGFLLQSSSLIDFSINPIALRPGASNALNDFSRTSLAGRIAQGFSILYGHRLGMNFTAHLRSYIESLPVSSAASYHKHEAMADFLFSNYQSSVLIESKGSFTLKTNDPSDIKKVLKKALETQIDPWMKYIQPPPINGYVVYTCLRENSWCPSALFVVDPVEEDGAHHDVPFSVDQVMRENYAAWLRAMGLWEPAERLGRFGGNDAAQSEPTIPAPFFIADLDEGRFAFAADAGIGRPRGTLIGMALDDLKAISTAIRNPGTPFTEIRGEVSRQVRDSKMPYSVFPDGSVLGYFRDGELSSRPELVRL